MENKSKETDHQGNPMSYWGGKETKPMNSKEMTSKEPDSERPYDKLTIMLEASEKRVKELTEENDKLIKSMEIFEIIKAGNKTMEDQEKEIQRLKELLVKKDELVKKSFTAGMDYQFVISENHTRNNALKIQPNWEEWSRENLGSEGV